MSAPSILAELAKAGASVVVSGDSVKLRYQPGRPLPQSLVDSARSQKAVILAFLKPSDEWSTGLGVLEAGPQPAGFELRLPQIIADAKAFRTRWGARAAALGWTVTDLIGAHPDAPAARWDCAGLLLITTGRPVVAMTADSATIGASGGAVLTFRSPAPGGVPLWDLIGGAGT